MVRPKPKQIQIISEKKNSGTDDLIRQYNLSYKSRAIFFALVASDREDALDYVISKAFQESHYRDVIRSLSRSSNPKALSVVMTMLKSELGKPQPNDSNKDLDTFQKVNGHIVESGIESATVICNEHAVDSAELTAGCREILQILTLAIKSFEHDFERFKPIRSVISSCKNIPLTSGQRNLLCFDGVEPILRSMEANYIAETKHDWDFMRENAEESLLKVRELIEKINPFGVAE